MKRKKQIYFEAYDLHTFGLHCTNCQIALSAAGYIYGAEVTLTFFLPDYDFINFISHKEIDEIKENLKKRIDEL